MNHPKIETVELGANVALGFAVCDWLVSDFYVYLSIDFSTCYHWWICLLVWLLSSFSFSFLFSLFKLFFCFNNLKNFIIIITFFLSCVADRVLGLWPGVRPDTLRWESWVQDIGPPETSQPHVISISESAPRDLHLNAKTQLHPTTSKLQCWTPHAKQLERQEHNPTH